MRSLPQAMDDVTAALYRVGDVCEEATKAFERRMPRPRLNQPYDALLKCLVWLFAIMAIDRVAGHPPSLQFLFLVPVWIAFEKSGVGLATCLAALVAPVTAITSLPTSWGAGWDFVVRAGIMVALVAVMTFHARRFRTTAESAQRDPLTGALNRAGFEDSARRSIETALGHRYAATVAVIDCDNFKELNDVKGHAFGDGVLRTLVRVLNASVEGAILGRTGGDEFVLVVPHASENEVRRNLKAALSSFTDATLVLGRRSTFTYGLAQLGADGMRYESLLEAADRDMYRGKAARYLDVIDVRDPMMA